MTTSAAPSPTVYTLAAILRGEEAPSPSRSDLTALFDAGAAEDILGLLHTRFRRAQEDALWPQDIAERLAQTTRENDARELLRQREVRTVLDRLARENVSPILLKGTPLAYSLYPTPASRPRLDCDMLIRREDMTAVKRSLMPLGYTAGLQCDGELLFHQFIFEKVDDFGLAHVFDFHWKISTQSVFADVLTHDELAQEGIPVHALGPHARTAGHVHGLLLACIHPVMHHGNVERLIWLYDIHLLASQLSPDDFDRFAELAGTKAMTAITSQQIQRARVLFGTRIPDRVLARLSTPADEPSASYLRAGRRWHHELCSNIRGLRSWRDRGRLVAQVLFPRSQYMLASYRLAPGPLTRLLVPALYVVRLALGIVKVVVGRK